MSQGCARSGKRDVAVAAGALEQRDGAGGDAGYWAAPAVADAGVDSSGEEAFKVAVEWGVAVVFLEVRVLCWEKQLAEKVAHVAKQHQEQVCEVGGDEDVQWAVFSVAAWWSLRSGLSLVFGETDGRGMSKSAGGVL